MKITITIKSNQLSKEDLHLLLQAIRDCEQQYFKDKEIFVSAEAPELTTDEMGNILKNIRPPYAYGPVVFKYINKKGDTLEQVIDDLQEMSMYAWRPCEECGKSAVVEHRPEKLKEFAQKRPDLVEGKRELWPEGWKNIPAEQLIEGEHCLIDNVCCGCCEKNHPDVYKTCQEAREAYEKDLQGERECIEKSRSEVKHEGNYD